MCDEEGRKQLQSMARQKKTKERKRKEQEDGHKVKGKLGRVVR